MLSSCLVDDLSEMSLLAGTIDEKIYQRQLMKGELASVMSASKDASKGGFSR